MQKLIEFYHNKGIDMLELGCTLPNSANLCLHKSTDSNFYPFIESDKDLLEKIRGDMVGGPSILFTRKAVVDETLLRKSSNLCKSIVGIGASQLYPYSMCQTMPTGLYTRWKYDSETKRFTARQNKSRSFENMILSYFHQSRPDCKIESNVTTGRQNKIDCFSVDGICYHCNTVFEAMGCYFHYCPCEEGSVSGGVSIKPMHQSKAIFEQISPINDLSAKNNSCKELLMGNFLVMSNVILNCLNTCATTFPTFPQFSKILW